jgi:hypothetical protein
MFGQTWSHDLIRKYVIIFGTLFNNIYITRENGSGENVQTLKVPLTYAPKEKMLARVNADPDLENQVAIILPHMSFELNTFQYDPSRKLNTIGKLYMPQADGSTKYVYSPVPYDIIFNLYIMVKNAEDGTKIIEQILPYFTPEFTVTANILPDLGKTHDIPLTLIDTSVNDIYEDDFSRRRTLVWTLTFAMKGYLYGPIRRSSLIHFSDVGFIIDPDPTNANTSLPLVAQVTSQPGQLANGYPTSNLELTVSYDEIDPNSDYAFINQFIEVFDDE